VAVLRGGASSEHEISLLSGANVLRNVDAQKYRAIDVFIDKAGIWHVRGVPMSPERALLGVDVAFNLLHGKYGEDGTLQRLFQRLGVPFIGPGAFASSFAMHKILAKEEIKKHGVKTPNFTILKVSSDLEKEALAAFRKFSPPLIIKPLQGGSSLGVTLAHTFDRFWEGVKSAFEHGTEVIVEEWIRGKEATVGVVEGLRGEEHYSLLPIEIIPAKAHSFFNYDAKYGEGTEEISPGSFTRSESAELERLARIAHHALGQKHYSRSDFIVSPRGIYYLETNSAPAVGMTENSLFPKGLAATGISFDEFFGHVIRSAAPHKHV
jgi:D-alanine-D-alanine ligase